MGWGEVKEKIREGIMKFEIGDEVQYDGTGPNEIIEDINDEGYIMGRYCFSGSLAVCHANPDRYTLVKKGGDMRKSDLKTGMWVELRNGNSHIVLLDTPNEGDVLGGNGWNRFSSYSRDLTNRSYKTLDIVKVFEVHPTDAFSGEDKKLIWEREETKEMTVAEISKKLGFDVKVVK